MTLVILPQAMRTILPPIGNECIAMLRIPSGLHHRRGRPAAPWPRIRFADLRLFSRPIRSSPPVYLIITLLLSKGVSMMEGRLTYYDRDRK